MIKGYPFNQPSVVNRWHVPVPLSPYPVIRLDLSTAKGQPTADALRDRLMHDDYAKYLRDKLIYSIIW